MNWDAIGAIGETIGALAVVFTLAYLAIQIRVARSVAADANRLTRANGVREFALSIANNKELLAIICKAYGVEEFYERYGKEFELSGEEAARLDFIHQFFFWLHFGQYASTNDAHGIEELKHLIGNFYNVNAVNYSWENSPFGKAFMDPNFVKFADEQVLKGRTRSGVEGSPPNE